MSTETMFAGRFTLVGARLTWNGENDIGLVTPEEQNFLDEVAGEVTKICFMPYMKCMANSLIVVASASLPKLEMLDFGVFFGGSDFDGYELEIRRMFGDRFCLKVRFGLHPEHLDWPGQETYRTFTIGTSDVVPSDKQ